MREPGLLSSRSSGFYVPIMSFWRTRTMGVMFLFKSKSQFLYCFFHEPPCQWIRYILVLGYPQRWRKSSSAIYWRCRTVCFRKHIDNCLVGCSFPILMTLFCSWSLWDICTSRSGLLKCPQIDWNLHGHVQYDRLRDAGGITREIFQKCLGQLCSSDNLICQRLFQVDAGLKWDITWWTTV